MNDQPPRELRWRCRRGMRELDALLIAWMDGHWGSADDEMRSAFADLLESEDDQLWNWLLGRSKPPRLDLKRIVDEIRGAPPATA